MLSSHQDSKAVHKTTSREIFILCWYSEQCQESYQDSHVVGSNCDYVHQADQFDNESKWVVYHDPNAEVAHSLGSFFQSRSSLPPAS